MRALICRNWGDIDTLELGEMPVPEPGPGQVLLDIVATSANYADAIMVAGNYQTKPEFPFAPGLEGAGFVVKLGKDVENLKVGDRVMAKLAHGGFAEQAVAEASETWSLFDRMSFVDGAAFAVAYLSAHVALRWRTEDLDGHSCQDVAAALKAGSPRIACQVIEGSVYTFARERDVELRFHVHTLGAGEEEIVARQLRAVLAAHGA